MLDNWAKFYEAISKPLPIASSIFLFISTSFLLLAGDSTLAALGLCQTITDYRWLVGLLFIIATAWLVVTSVMWAGKRGYQLWSVRQTEKKQRQRLHVLTVDERRILSGYVENESRTQIFHAAPDLGAAQGLSDDGVLYRPDVAQEGVAVTYNIQEWALDYLSRNREMLAAAAGSETRWSSRSISAKSTDWFARGTALLAIILTIIGLYFTHRTYNWQTKESLEERVSVRGWFTYKAKSHNGNVTLYLVNEGVHPIYVQGVSIEEPCDSTDALISKCEQCEVVCGVVIDHSLKSNKPRPLKLLEAGNEVAYETDSWDFTKYPLQELAKTKELKDELWIDVHTSKKTIKLHPITFGTTMVNANGSTEVSLPH